MKITFSRGMAAKGNNGCNPSWFGRTWGFWFPRFHHNKGNAFKKQVFDCSISWLCFWIGMTVWPYWKNIDEGSCQTVKEHNEIKGGGYEQKSKND